MTRSTLRNCPRKVSRAEHGVEVGSVDPAALGLAALHDQHRHPVHDHGGEIRPLGDHDVLAVFKEKEQPAGVARSPVEIVELSEPLPELPVVVGSLVVLIPDEHGLSVIGLRGTAHILRGS